MIKILKKVEIYTPMYSGKKDLLIAGGCIERIANNIESSTFPGSVIEKMDGKIAIPGFIDGHVHVIGGGGEGGFTSRISEIQTSKLLGCGITTVIGLLGTDSITKSLISLFAKIQALREDGINAYMMTGSYQYPVRTITGSIERDIVLLDPVIGVGELAISDHRSSSITVDEIKKLSQECRVASMLSNKSGKVIVHVGKSSGMLSPLIEAVSDDEISINIFLPTHINRNRKLLENGAEWMKMGGFVDLTADTTSGESVKIKDAIKYLTENGGDIDHILVSSDAQGSIPSFDEKGNFLSMNISDCAVMFKTFKECIGSGMSIEDALKPLTVNVANFFKLKNTGILEENRRADMILLDRQTFEMSSIMVNGELYHQNL
jgi:beta-aspartyl-dipeptidase (metallo-type)